MSGIAPSELILLFVVGLLVLGPERLPKVTNQVGRWVGRARGEVYRFRRELEREMTLSEIKRTPPEDPPRSEDADSVQSPSDRIVR